MAEQNKTGIRNGLTTEKALELQKKYGKNLLIKEKNKGFLFEVLKVLFEPMFLLLFVAAVIYFFLGEPRDGLVMLISVIGIITIDLIQEWKTDKTLAALKNLSSPKTTVIRDGEEKQINSEDIVPGDLMLITEGLKIPADGFVIKKNDLCVDESTLTGEAQGVWKIAVSESTEEQDGHWRLDRCYAGTLVTQGSGIVCVDKIGAETEYGKIGTDVASAPDIPTPLQKQTNKLVSWCAAIAALLFVLVGIVTWINIPDHEFKDRLIESVLSGITLAMAMIPEEFPVILTVFLSMGAWRLAKKHSLVRRLPAVETLGAVSVLCVDKTGTITMNQMTVQETWAVDGGEKALCEIMGMGCETETYDPMEQAMLTYCESIGINKNDLFSGELLKEYPFTHEAKMMGHVWKRGGKTIIAAKGSPERILTLCGLTEQSLVKMEQKQLEMSQKGLRVIAVATAEITGSEIPSELSECKLEFCGFVGLADPPRPSVKGDITRCIKAGVRVVMITGDNGFTASSIAKQIGMPNCDKIITGSEIDKMTDEQLRDKIKDVNIFSRVVPEHKMRIVKAFKANGEVVAMTGDGVNDAPALKYADIGISMGKRGSEVSKEASDLILLDDNFSTIVDTIDDGRRIYDNIRKAFGYVVTIHIPIALSSLLAPLIHINPLYLMLLPLHVVLLELVIDPTCSIVFERQPAEQDIMERPPRNPKESIITPKMLGKSILQGLAVFAASFGAYFTLLYMGADATLARTFGISIIFISNLFLVYTNSSKSSYAVFAVKRLVKDRVMWFISIGTVVLLLAAIYTPLNSFLRLQVLSAGQFAAAILISFAAVMWNELVKLASHIKNRK